VTQSEIHGRRLAETLSRVAKAIAQRDDLHEIVQVVTDETTAITGAQFGAFFYNVVDREGESYSLYTISGVPRERFERFPMPRNSEIFRPTFEGSATLRLDDVTLDPRYGRNPPYYGMPAGHLPVRSYLAASVFSRGGNVVGGLFFGHEEAGVFTPEHERVAEQIATQAGLAIEQAQLLATERAARAEAEARADAAIALEAVEDGIAMVDDQGIVRLWNRAAERITGLRAGVVLGRPIGQAVAGWERIALRIPVGEQRGATTPATLPLDTVTGHERWLSLYGIAVASGTVYAFRDVTGQRELDALRADVVATVSHELRTPIAAVYGAARTLRDRDLDAATSERLLEVIGTESDRLAALVEEILLTSQIDSGSLTVDRSEIDPGRAVAASLAGHEASSIVVDLPADAPLACGDPEKVRQVVANFVENALKYGRPPVTVRVRDVRGAVRFEVSDSGRGIPRHEQQNIFEKFYRLETHVREGVRGTGLGLYICRELIQRMDGQIGVDSAEGRGTTFWIALPRLEGRP
jgi:PAS domain S-box-containing protein